MKRRTFIKDAGLAAAVLAGPSLASCVRKRGGEAENSIAGSFNYRDDGSFTLLQFTDTHYISGDPRSKRAMDCVEEALQGVKPDLVIHTGDILFGKPDIESALEILAPVSESGIPFSVALGNHDSQFGSSREEVFAAIRSLRGCINLPPKEGVYGCSNDVITLGSEDSPEKVLYIF
jgi:Predicted phosphohydrolases